MFEQPIGHSNQNRQERQGQGDLQKLLDFDSNFRELFRNMYKYADEIEVGGNKAIDSQKVFERVVQANDIIEAVVNISNDFYRNNNSLGNEGIAALNSAIDRSNLWTSSSGIDSEAILAGFEWSLHAWKTLGQKYGRPMTIPESDIPILVSSLRDRIDDLEKAGLL